MLSSSFFPYASSSCNIMSGGAHVSYFQLYMSFSIAHEIRVRMGVWASVLCIPMLKCMLAMENSNVFCSLLFGFRQPRPNTMLLFFSYFCESNFVTEEVYFFTEVS
jgi:hypothetical protein